MIRVPETFGGDEARKLRRELRSKIGNHTPCVVVDMSRVKRIELDGLEGLLECMEEVANHDGALELGAISAEAATMLELTRMDQLFRKFPAFQTEAASSLLLPERVAQSDQVSRAPAAQPQPMVA
jgi:anti-anti-sigma regulatory factor